MKKDYFKKGMKDGIPIGLGYFAVSFTFGIAAISSGLTIWNAVLISLTNLTSAGQFAAIGIIAAGGAYMELALTQLVINLRYSLMSFSLAQKLDRNAKHKHRYIMAFGVTDEIFALGANVKDRLNPYYHYGAMTVAIPGWVGGTLLGTISGSLLPNFMVSALGVAIYAMFLAIILPPAKKDNAVLKVVLCAMLISGLFAIAPILKNISSGFVIIITTVLVSGIAAWLKPIQEESNTKELDNNEQ